jgi:hypothetical protein
MTLPLSGIAIAVAGSASIIWGACKKNGESIKYLGATVLVTGAFNAYIEDSRALTTLVEFKNVVLILLIGFLWTYTMLVLSLLRKPQNRRRGAFSASFLPLLYVLALGLAIEVPSMKNDENPPAEAFLFLVFILAIHLPAFAFGRSRAEKVMGELEGVPKTNFKYFLSSIGPPSWF